MPNGIEVSSACRRYTGSDSQYSVRRSWRTFQARLFMKYPFERNCAWRHGGATFGADVPLGKPVVDPDIIRLGGPGMNATIGFW